VPATNVASGVIAANAAAVANTPSTLVRRDASGGFSAGTVTGNFVGTAPGLIGLDGGAVATGTVADARLSANVALLNGSQAFAGTNLFSGPVRLTNAANLLAGTIGGDGSALTNLTATALVGTAPSATNFTGPLLGDVTGSQAAATVSTVGGLPAASVAFGVNRANAATPTNQLGTIVRRDPCDASFVAGAITASRFVGDGSGLTNLPTTPPYYGAPAGAVLVSLFSPDTALEAGGYRQFMSTTVPSWVNGSTGNAPTARDWHSTLWSGQAMIVWGGTAGGVSYISSGASYDPAMDAWASLSSVGAPSARAYHTAVWTDTQMIVWGGKGASGYLGTGARYNPSANTWSTVSTSGAPAARMGQVSVWTGSKMVVWGGINTSGLLNDGALYDPALNQWTTITLPNTPEVRMNATAVWAGDRMIVWGGTGESGDLNTGGQLLFSNGVPAQWLASTTTGAPYARIGHTAIWAGDRMIVWGGQSGGVPLADGAVYCASCDEWKDVSPTNAPLPRYDHSAVWTGSEMLIVDGANVAGPLSSSAGYDPSTQQWRPLSNIGSPLARSLAGAVWSGTEVLVFGGYSGSQTLATLQRISPQPAWYFYRKL
jgi:N-acetylneuraminic acid mutarotase